MRGSGVREVRGRGERKERCYVGSKVEMSDIWEK